MTKKKGQVVVFFILAIVILFTMLFMFYVVKQNSTKDTEKTMQRVEDENAIRDRVYDDVQSCFNQASSAGMKLLGRYAGYMPTAPEETPYITPYFDETSGTPLTFPMEGNIGVSDSEEFLDFNGEKIVILIKNNEDATDNYPCTTENCDDYELEDFKTEISDCFYMPNVFFCKRNIPEGCEIIGTSTDCDCHCFEGPNNQENISGTYCYNSAQASVERYIKNYFFQCINTLRNDLTGYKLYPETLDDVQMDSYFAKTNIEFFVESDVYLESNTTGTLIEFPRVNSNSYDMGLKAFYVSEFRKLFEKECLVANENIVGDLSLYLEDYDDVDIKQYIYNDKLYDVISVFLTTDELYVPIEDGKERLVYSGGINGDAFNFTFARENRCPALEKIKASDITVDGAEITINFRVADPDEDVFGEDAERNTLKLYLNEELYTDEIKSLGNFEYQIKTDNLLLEDFEVCDGVKGSDTALCVSQEIEIPTE